MSQNRLAPDDLQHATLNLFEVANWHGLELTCNSGVCKIERAGASAIMVADNSARIVTHLISLFDRYTAMVEPTERQGKLAVFDFTRPRLHQFQDSDLEFWFSGIPEDAYPVPGYLSKYRPRKGESVFDLGACSGVTSYFFSKLVGSAGRVFAYEPDDLNFEMLERNIALHRLENVHPIRKAVWKKTGTVSFSVTGGTTGSVGDGAGTVPIPAVSLEQAVTDAAGTGVSLVKMDVEGAEVEIIEASRDFIQSRDLRFAIASYHIVDKVPASVRLEKTFRECGYEAKTGFPTHPTTWAWPGAQV